MIDDRTWAALDTVMHEHDLGDEPITIKHYLGQLLFTVWTEKEGFSGKRPFGNSGWDYDLYTALVGARLVDGEVGDDGLRSVNRRQADDLIGDCILAIFGLPRIP